MRNERWKDGELAQFSLHLSQMLSAGIPLMESLSIARGTAGKKKDQAYSLLIEHLKGGVSLSEGLKRIRYPPFFCFLLAASEHHGQMPEALKQASEFYLKKHQRHRKLRKALAYPTLILLSSTLTLWMILAMLLPQLSSLYFTLQVELPPFTQWMLSLSENWEQIQLWLLVGVFCFLLILFFFYRHHRLAFEKGLLKIPILSAYFRLHLSSTVSLQTGILLESGLTVMQACQLFISEGHWLLIREAFQHIQSRLQEGMPLSKAAASCPPFLPILSEMLLVAEQAGTLGHSLQNLGSQLEGEMDGFIEQASGTLESVITLGAGSIVLLMIMALFVPLFQLISQF